MPRKGGEELSERESNNLLYWVCIKLIKGNNVHVKAALVFEHK